MKAPGPNEALIRNPERDSWFLFAGHGRVLSTAEPAGVVPLLREAEEAVESKGLGAVGFIAYEASPGFDPALSTRPPGGFPLAWFLLSDAWSEIDGSALPLPPPEEEPLRWTPTVTEDEYRTAVRAIRNRISEGDTYQVNYSYRLRSPFSGDPFVLFKRMIGAQPTPFSAYIHAGRYVVCSASPELFFSLKNGRLTSRPMKGTAPRGLTSLDDREHAERLRRSEKERAENIMIVDMMRNDIGRVARSGTVCVPHLCMPEKYPTVWQLTSTVEGETDAGVTGILTALFPAASITGAPKRATMEIIRDLESTPRRIYTGAIGTIFPGRKAAFSVAIRTALVDRQAGEAEYGVGGGIVWKSTEEGELAESRTKALVITATIPEFALLETMVWKPGEGYLFLEAHLRRMDESADYFSYPFSAESADRILTDLARSFQPLPQKVRLLAGRDGRMTTESEQWISGNSGNLHNVCLAASPVDSSDRFLYHKTTHRLVYDRARSGMGECDDVILWNERGELTESTIASLFLEMDGALVTPPVSAGLLPGVYRQWMLNEGRAHEASLARADLARASRVFLGNSVRGLYEVKVRVIAPQ